MTTLAERKKEALEAFALYDDWLDKYEQLIAWGKDLQAYPESDKTEERLVPGCQSRVWLKAELREGRIYFLADSDALITRGMVCLLVKVYSGCTPQEILADDFAFLDELGLRENLSPTRASGLASMVEKLRRMARENS